MLSKSKTFAGLAAVAALGAAASPAFAHHSANAQFDTSKEMQVTGTLTEMDDINPHSRWLMIAKGANGQPVKWQFESVSPNALRHQGVHVKEDIKPGDTYGFIYSPAWDGTNTGLLTAMVINGKRVQYVNV